MKVALVAVVFAVLVVNAAEACREQDDCGDDECCLYQSFSVFRGGICEKLAQEGEGCNEEEENQIFGKYIKHCPCESGLTCEPEEVKDWGIFGKIKLNERCVIGPSTPRPRTTAEPESERPPTTDYEYTTAQRRRTTVEPESEAPPEEE